MKEMRADGTLKNFLNNILVGIIHSIQHKNNE